VLAVRTTGAYFLLLTLALGMIVWGVCLRWTSVTGGENGMRATLRPDYLSSPTAFYYLVLAVFAVSAILMWRVVHSPFGLSLRGLRDSESRMRALGYAVPLQAFIGFVISGLFSGIAGVLFAMFNGFVSPSAVALSQSVSALLMVIIGGTATLFGGLIGAGLITIVADRVSVITDRWSLVLGLLFIATMIVAPNGILGFFRARTMAQNTFPENSAEKRRI
jgi:branched-chain amino acid transport system permease protein